jgi:hypothetical protein
MRTSSHFAVLLIRLSVGLLFFTNFDLFTLIANTPLLIINIVAIGTINIPELFQASQGFVFIVSDFRTGFAKKLKTEQ